MASIAQNTVSVTLESSDAVYKKIIESPYYPFRDFSVTPLINLKMAHKAGGSFLTKMVGESPPPQHPLLASEFLGFSIPKLHQVQLFV